MIHIPCVVMDCLVYCWRFGSYVFIYLYFVHIILCIHAENYTIENP